MDVWTIEVKEMINNPSFSRSSSRYPPQFIEKKKNARKNLLLPRSAVLRSYMRAIQMNQAAAALRTMTKRATVTAKWGGASAGRRRPRRK
jgi:hypothetical protein